MCALYFLLEAQTDPCNAGAGTASDWQGVTAGADYTRALKADGTLYCWGYNNAGQLGDGTTGTKYLPTQVGTASNWQNVAAGYAHTCALKADGTLYCWGNNLDGQLGDETEGQTNAPAF